MQQRVVGSYQWGMGEGTGPGVEVTARRGNRVQRQHSGTLFTVANTMGFPGFISTRPNTTVPISSNSGFTKSWSPMLHTRGKTYKQINGRIISHTQDKTRLRCMWAGGRSMKTLGSGQDARLFVSKIVPR
jgi:hypothetical protein